jgi:hypothetical protein
MTVQTLPAGYAEALRRFAAWSNARHTKPGRKKPTRQWRDVLAEDYWYNARLWKGEDGRDEFVGSRLHAIRNHFGSEWLYHTFVD